MSNLPSYDEANNPSLQPGSATNQPYTQPGSYATSQPVYPPMNAGYPATQPQYPPVDHDVYQNKSGYPAPSNNPPPSVINPTATVTSPGQVLVTQPHQTQTTVIVANQPYRNQVYRGFPIEMTCPYCHENMTTNMSYTVGGLTWVLCGVIALVGCFCGCCLIPFCVDGCKDIQHNCSKCGRMVGRYHKL